MEEVASSGVAENLEDVHRTIFEEMEEAVFLVDVGAGDERFTYRWNNASHRRRTGLSGDEFTGATPRALLGDEQAAAVVANYQQCVDSQEPINYEKQLDLPAGTRYWQTKLTPITEDGRVTQVVGVSRDITERKRRERRQERTVRRFETVLETMSAAVFLKSVDGEYQLMNRACRELFGVEEGEADGLTDEDLFPPEVAQQARTDDERIITTGEMIEIEETIPMADGFSTRLTRKSPVFNEGSVVGVCGVSTDITEQNRREQELERLKERFELAVEGGNLGVWDWNMQTDAVEFNEQWAQMIGHSPDEIEPHLDEWERRVHPDDLSAIEAALDEHIAGETAFYDAEHRIRTADGDWKWIRAVGRIVERDDAGDPVRAVGVHLDTDARKNYERTLERQRDDLEVLNQIVRHDVRNALQLVLAYGTNLQGEVETEHGDELRQLLAAARKAVDITRSAGEVTELLVRSKTDHAPVHVGRVLERQVTAVGDSHERATVSVEQLPSDATVLADDMLQSVIRNLLTNAIVHNDTDTPTVTVSAATDDAVVRIRVADDGPGISDDWKERIFEKGETTLGSDGTGLGLYLVSTLVDRYDGSVWVEDNDPTGSVFVVELPRHDRWS